MKSKKLTILTLFLLSSCVMTTDTLNAKTLIVYYSYTNNVHEVAVELSKQIDADVVRIEPAVKGLDYAANNYAIGSAQIAAIRNNPNVASSYPAIDPVSVDFDKYDTIIVGAPLWWSQMAAPLQTFLFQNGSKMAGKNIGLIVSSHSSGISGVESDAKRLIPGGRFLAPSLWIRSEQTSNAKSMLENWLNEINYNALTSVITITDDHPVKSYSVYTLAGRPVSYETDRTNNLPNGIYIVNGEKTLRACSPISVKLGVADFEMD